MTGGHQERDKRAGTENVAGIVGLGKACEIAKRDLEKNIEYLKSLRDYFIKLVEEKIEIALFNGSKKLRVSGNSMNSVGIFDGALVLVKKVPVENRQIGVVRVNGDEATIKQIIFNEDTVVLQPRSTDPTIEPLILKKEDFDNNYAEIIGKVVDVSFDPNDMLK